MDSRQHVFAQLMDFLPTYEFHKCVDRYNGNYKVKSFSCWDQFLCMAFAQLTYRESLRDIEAVCVRPAKLYHMGFRGKVSRNTLANANQVRDWRIYADFAQVLIARGPDTLCRRRLWRGTGPDRLRPRFHRHRSVSVSFPWAKFRKHKGSRQSSTPCSTCEATFPPGSSSPTARSTMSTSSTISSSNRRHLHHGSRISRLCPAPQNPPAPAFFVTRAKSNFQFRRLYSHAVDKNTGLQCDQTIVLQGLLLPTGITPTKLRRDPLLRRGNQAKRLCFLTNNFALPASTIAELYRCRWQVELFFKWIKQHLRIKAFYGTIRECGEDPDLDCHLRLRAGCHRQKATETGTKPLHNSTDFERHSFRENAHFTGIFTASDTMNQGCTTITS